MFVYDVVVYLCLLQKILVSAQKSISLTPDAPNQLNAEVQTLGTGIVSSGQNYWDIQNSQSSSVDWSLWIQANNTWGFHSTSSQRFTLQLTGMSVIQSPNDCDMLIAFTDGLENTLSKYFSMEIKLDSEDGYNMISPGCGNLTKPTPSLNPGDPYYNMDIQNSDPYFNVSEPAGDRTCRAGYNPLLNTCIWENFGPSSSANTWPLQFSIDNYPTENRMIATFSGTGYPAVSCVFNETMVLNAGIMIYITAADNNDYFSISEVYLSEYPITALTTNSTQNPTTDAPALSPSKARAGSPPKSPSQIPTKPPLNVSAQAPPNDQGSAPSEAPPETPTDIPSTSPSSADPATSPTMTSLATSRPTSAAPSNVLATNANRGGEGAVGEPTTSPILSQVVIASTDEGAMDLNSLLLIIIIVLLVLVLCGIVVVICKRKNKYSMKRFSTGNNKPDMVRNDTASEKKEFTEEEVEMDDIMDIEAMFDMLQDSYDNNTATPKGLLLENLEIEDSEDQRNEDMYENKHDTPVSNADSMAIQETLRNIGNRQVDGVQSHVIDTKI